jgi:peptidoglycan/LPS O-acetylase OafA/YrhL
MSTPYQRIYQSTYQIIGLVIYLCLTLYALCTPSTTPTSPLNFVNFLPREQQIGQTRMFRWATPHAYITGAVRNTGPAIITYTATSAQHSLPIQLTLGDTLLATHIIQPDHFRVYHALITVPWQPIASEARLGVDALSAPTDPLHRVVAISDFTVHSLARIIIPDLSTTVLCLVGLFIGSCISVWAWRVSPLGTVALLIAHCIISTVLPRYEFTQLFTWYTVMFGMVALTPRIITWLQLPTGAMPVHAINTAKNAHAYRPDIDGLRAIAVMSVLLYHIFPEYISGGFIGVDVFFVISGYLISQIIITQVAANQFTIRDFYIRRVRRIFPALGVMLIITTILAWLLYPYYLWVDYGHQLLAGVGFVSNIYSYATINYFEDVVTYQPILHLWSLGVEEQFYLLWPLLIYAAFRWHARFSHIVILVTLWSFASNILLIQSYPNATFYLPMMRIWELGLGGIIAYQALSAPHGATTHWVRAEIVGVLSLTAIVGSAVLFDKHTLFPGYWALVPVLGAVGIVHSAPQSRILKKIISARIMVWIGLISFPLYLWHWPILQFSTLLLTTLDTIQKFAVLGMSIICAVISYRVVEQPIRRGRWRTLSPLIIVAIMGLIGAGGAVIAQGWSVPLRQLDLADSINAELRLRQYTVPCDALMQQSFAGDCMTRRGTQLVDNEYIIIGDSHARALALGFIDAQLPQTVTSFSRNACLPLLGIEVYEQQQTTPIGCDDGHGFSQVIAMLQANPPTQRRTVVIVGRYGLFATQGLDRGHEKYIQFAGARIDLTSTERYTVLSQTLDNTLKQLTELPNTHVVFVHQVPEFNFPPTSCYYHVTIPFIATPPQICSTPRATIDTFFAPYKTTVASVLARYPSVAQYDPMPLFCSARDCAVVVADTRMYNDTNHVSVAGARRIAVAIATQFP